MLAIPARGPHHHVKGQVWWHRPVVPVLGRLTQKGGWVSPHSHQVPVRDPVSQNRVDYFNFFVLMCPYIHP